jgi:mannose-1-phosphate guanylyltransferase/mannose-6-phosphate isomerase
MSVIAQDEALDRVAPSQIHPVILSGGSGTRLWPLSRALFPKQLLPLTSERTMIQETVLRTADAGYAAPLVISNVEHRFLIAEQLDQIGMRPKQIVLEPVGRNTAPALAVAALILAKSDPDAVILAQPSDHLICDLDAFRSAVVLGQSAAAMGRLVTFGVPPCRPETGYGYIARGNSLADSEGAFAIEKFIEKPAPEIAERLLTQDFLWNSGIFLLPIATLLAELEKFEPRLLDLCEAAVRNGIEDLGFFRLNASDFGRAPSISIDRAVMERTSTAAVVPVNMAWTDIGSWRSLHAMQPHDDNGNAVEGDVILEDVHNSYVRSQGHLTAAIGLDGVVVVSTEDATLVAPADRAAEVETIVERMRRSNRAEPLCHRRVYRPWGFYQTVDAGEHFQVKRIMVRPGAQLSLQMHYHRAEHWVVVAGTARVTRGETTMILRDNESIYIPLGTRHRLENPGRLPLHLIEVQSGPYLGEDDIVRFEDVYGRSENQSDDATVGLHDVRETGD